MPEQPTKRISRWRSPTTYLIKKTRAISIVDEGRWLTIVIGDDTLRLSRREATDLTAALVERSENDTDR